jgi:hypothetical protein
MNCPNFPAATRTIPTCSNESSNASRRCSSSSRSTPPPLCTCESPTTRGFASILAQGLDGLSVAEVLAVPDDYPQTIGLTQAVSPLRIRGMSAMLARTKRRLRALP